jgi:predicted nucleotidyltransferase
LTIEDLAKPGMVFQIGVEPSRIDILTAISGVGFDHAWANRLSIEMDGIDLCVIGREDLIVNKRACGRPKDIADAEPLDPTDSYRDGPTT